METQIRDYINKISKLGINILDTPTNYLVFVKLPVGRQLKNQHLPFMVGERERGKGVGVGVGDLEKTTIMIRSFKVKVFFLEKNVNYNHNMKKI